MPQESSPAIEALKRTRREQLWKRVHYQNCL